MSQIDLKIALWNGNGLQNHLYELEAFLKSNKIDILLATETHGTDRTSIRIPGYNAILANHPSNKAYGGSAIIIKNALNYVEYPPDTSDAIQLTKIELKFSQEIVVISSIYCRPRFALKETDFDNMIQSLGNKFIAGGDFNSKHTFFGSRLSNPKGRELFKSISKNNVTVLSGGSPTYWPTDPQKIPDLIDFFMSRGLNRQMFSIDNSYDLSSDHSPVILTCCRAVDKRTVPKIVNYNKFRENIQNKINLKVRLQSAEDIEKAVDELNNLIKTEIENCSREQDTVRSSSQYSNRIRSLIEKKRKLRANWQITRYPGHKTELNRAEKELKAELAIARDQENEDRIKNLSATKISDYSLWKELKYIKKPAQRREPIKTEAGDWIRTDEEKARTFKEHLCEVFTPYTDNQDLDHLRHVEQVVNCPLPMSLDINYITVKEVKFQIKKLNARKSPGPDGITARAIKNLPHKVVVLLTYIFNAILRLGYFPAQWKLARVIMILKPGKPSAEVGSYRPISILSVFSKLIERLILTRMHQFLRVVIPDHQFGFREEHSTAQQCHRVVDYVKKGFEKKEYCSGVFLDVSKAFDKVWHQGLEYKMRSVFPPYLFVLLKSFLSERQFFVQCGLASSQSEAIQSGVPQGSVLGPHLYVLYTHDLPVIEDGMCGTFADDTTYLCSDKDPQVASQKIQIHLNKVEKWCKKWNLRINANKSQHITFTLNKRDSGEIRFGSEVIKHTDTVKYLGLTLDRRLTFGPHIKLKRIELNLKRRRLYHILNAKSALSLKNKLLIYNTTIKPVWLYCCQLWGLASKSNIDIIQRFQNISLRVCTGAPNYIRNEDLHRDLKIKTVQEEISCISERHRAKSEVHNNLLVRRTIEEELRTSRLSKKLFCNI